MRARREEVFDFLGYHFERGHHWPREKSLKKIKETLRRHTQRNQGGSWEEIVGGVNRSLRGWHEYYQHSVSNVFAPLDGFVRRRLRSLLAKRRGRTVHGKGTAHQRWPNEWLARHGLLSLKELHDWKRTIVRLRTHGLESRMREIRPSGSEGGARFNPLFLPYPI